MPLGRYGLRFAQRQSLAGGKHAFRRLINVIDRVAARTACEVLRGTAGFNTRGVSKRIHIFECLRLPASCFLTSGTVKALKTSRQNLKARQWRAPPSYRHFRRRLLLRNLPVTAVCGSMSRPVSLQASRSIGRFGIVKPAAVVDGAEFIEQFGFDPVMPSAFKAAMRAAVRTGSMSSR